MGRQASEETIAMQSIKYAMINVISEAYVF